MVTEYRVRVIRVPPLPVMRAFYGRGLMRPTWPSLYDDYGKIKSFANNNSRHYSDSRISATTARAFLCLGTLYEKS